MIDKAVFQEGGGIHYPQSVEYHERIVSKIVTGLHVGCRIILAAWCYHRISTRRRQGSRWETL